MLGPASDTGTDLLDEEAVPPPADTVPSLDPAAAGVTDLDERPAADEQPVPEAAPSRRGADAIRLRSAAPLLVALAAGALLGGVVGSGASERAALAERRETIRVLAALTVPEQGLHRHPPNPQLRMRLLLLNAGPDPVTVTRARVEASQATVRLDSSVDLPPGRSVRVGVSVLPDCGPGAPGGLRLIVTTPEGEPRDVAAGTFGPGIGISLGELPRFCGALLAEPIPVWRTTAEEDGALSVQLRNIRSEPVLLDVTAPPGTTIVGEPPLPAELPTDRSMYVWLRVQVDRCTAAAQRANAGEGVRLLVDGEPEQVFPDTATVVGWFAQRVADACSAG